VNDRVVPYPGLRPFEEKDRAIFFGREAQMVSVLSLLEEQQFVAVVGSSGSGKSSLILAGVIPAVREGFLRGTREWKIVTLKPGSDPCGNLARALEREGLGQDPAASSRSAEEPVRLAAEFGSPALSSAEDGAQTLVEKLHATDRSLVDLLTPSSPSRVPAAGEERGELSISAAVTLTAPQEAGGPRVLIIVDQFEELFTFRRAEAETGSKTARFAPRDEAATFVRLLLRACAEPAGRIAVIITMRSDFIGDCDAFLELPELISQCQFLVPRLNRSQMREAIERPGQVEDLGYAPFAFEEGLVNRIIADAGDRLDQLPLMQHALMRTWKEGGGPDAPPGSSNTLTADHYEKAGKITGALSKHADLAWATIKEDKVKAQLTRQLFLLLSDVHPDGKIVRRRPLLSEVQAVTGAEIPAIEEIVRLFQSDDRNFLLPPLKEDDHLAEGDHLDISHEALVRQWTEFGKWLIDEAEWNVWLQELSQAAKDYEKDPTTERWHGNDLRGAEEWMKQAQPSEAWAHRHGVTNWKDCLAFLDRSRSETARLNEEEYEKALQLQREKERHQKNILKISRVAAAILLLVAALMTYSFFKAQSSENRAKAVVDVFTTTADDVAYPITAYARFALSDAEQRSEKLKLAIERAATEAPPEEAAVDDLLRSQDETEKAEDAIRKMSDSLKKAANLAQNQNLRNKADQFAEQAEKVRKRREALLKSPEAFAIVKKTLETRASLIETELAPLRGQQKLDAMLAKTYDENIVRANAHLNALDAIEPAAQALGFSRMDFPELMGRMQPLVATLDSANELRQVATTATDDVTVWKKATAVELKHSAKINRVRFAPVLINNKALIASAGEDKTVRLWDTDGKALAERTISSPINDIAFNPQGNALAAASNGSTVRVFHWTGDPNSAAMTSFERHSDSITDVEFSHGGDRIVSASGDRTVRVFLFPSMEQFYFTSPPLPGIVTSVSFHSGSNIVLSGCDDGGVRLHTIIDQKEVVLLGKFDAPARRPEFSSDGKLVIAASGDKTARVWRTFRGPEIVRTNHLAPVTQATFRPLVTASGYTFVTTATNGEIRLVQFSDLTTQSADYPGKVMERRHPGAAVFAAWSADGRWLATVGGAEVLLWEWKDDALVARVRIVDLHRDTSRAEFSPDAHLLVAYGGDQFAYVWDLTKLPPQTHK
jgi:WD40 repeat protein/energy-coupling factor transporter ATP-binding protein EcfA2